MKIVRRMSGIIELVCEHSIGHPIFIPKSMGKSGGVHGCDGCCRKEEFKKVAKEWLSKQKWIAKRRTDEDG